MAPPECYDCLYCDRHEMLGGELLDCFLFTTVLIAEYKNYIHLAYICGIIMQPVFLHDNASDDKM